MILLDTHALIWLVEGSSELGAKARAVADEALASDALAVAAISFWEVAMLRRKGRIVIDQSVADWRASLLDAGLVEVAIDGAVGSSAAELEDLHDDPADRIIIATASRLGATLMTADRRILDWSGPLRTRDARR